MSFKQNNGGDASTPFQGLIITMTILLNADWSRGVQLFH